MDFEYLFSCWRQAFTFQTFVKDGIVDPDAYQRILLILRDKNCGNGCGAEADICRDLRRDGGGWQKLRSVSLDRDWWFYWTRLDGREVPAVSFCHPQVTHLRGDLRGHDLFEALYRDMLLIRTCFSLGK